MAPCNVAVPTLHSDFSGYQALARLASATEPIVAKPIILGCKGMSWLDANMCAPFGAVLARMESRFNEIEFEALDFKIETVLSRNKFLAPYGYGYAIDGYGTSIPYRRLRLREQEALLNYLTSLLSHPGIPQMTPTLRRVFREKILEIFSNAEVHSDSKLGAFACGQFYPTKQRLIFSIADAGLGIPTVVSTYLDQVLTGPEALRWALTDGNTTKKGDIPGGMGLNLLMEFATMNKGRLQIASGEGFYELDSTGESYKQLDTPFPGTTVTIEINTADDHSYALADEPLTA